MIRLKNEQKKDPHLRIPEPWLNRNITYHYNDYRLNIYIPTYYPFHPPKIMCGDMDHIMYFLKKKQFFHDTIEKYYKQFQCICCYNITCVWVPSMTIRQLVQEYINYDITMRYVINTYLLQKDTPLAEDIWKYIISFLELPIQPYTHLHKNIL